MAFRQAPVANGGDQKSSKGYNSDPESSSGSSSRCVEGASRVVPVKPLRKRGGGGGSCCIGFNFVIVFVVVITLLFYIERLFLVFPGTGDSENDAFFNHKVTSRTVGGTTLRTLNYGLQGFESREGHRDSRDWDTDDRDRSDTVMGDVEDDFQEEYARFRAALKRYQHRKLNPVSYERIRKELELYEQLYQMQTNSTEILDEEEDYDEEDWRDADAAEPVRRMSEQEPKSVGTVAPKAPKSRRRHRRAPCEIKFPQNSTALMASRDNSKFAQFQLDYVTTEERPLGGSDWRPKFAGHQSWEEREKSFHAGNQTVHCGFVEDTGFDISQRDKDFLGTCKVAVSSCIFGKSDQLHTPRKKTVSISSRKESCFVMFVDQSTLDVMIMEGQAPDKDGYLGLWRIVLVRNLPYSDFRRVGKIPKFLAHRLFPNAKYSIWLDSKLRLQSDPLSILDYFLLKGNHEYAISNHYDRHCVWEEVQQNKRLNKYNHTLIDEQFNFYQSDGLTKFNASDPKRLLPSYVPEGSLIIRAHTPMSNFFSCLWFNEVERFTPRDQLSFAYTYLKLVRTNPGLQFRFNMFKDCERRMVCKLYRHRPVDDT